MRLEAVHVDGVPRHGSASRFHVHVDRAVTFWKVNHGPTLLRIGNVICDHYAVNVALNQHNSARLRGLSDQHRLRHRIRHVYFVNLHLRIEGQHVVCWHAALPFEGSKLKIRQPGIAGTIHCTLHERWRQRDRKGQAKRPQRNKTSS